MTYIFRDPQNLRWFAEDEKGKIIAEADTYGELAELIKEAENAKQVPSAS